MLDKFKSYLESIKITPTNWLLGVSGIMMVRFFLESLSNPSTTGYFASDASTLVHYYLFYMTGFLLLFILLPILMPKWRNVIPQLVLFSALASIISPIIDWLVSLGKGFRMAYLFDAPKDMLHSFFSFLDVDGVTPGLRLEIGLSLIGFAFLIYFIEKSWKRAVLSPVILYIIVFALFSIPGFISIIGQVPSLIVQEPSVFIQTSIDGSITTSNNLHNSLQYSSYPRLLEVSFNFMMGKILLFLSVTVLVLWSYINHKQKLKTVIDNFRAERVSAYVVMVVFGTFVARMLFPGIDLNWNDWMSLFTLCLSFSSSFLFAVYTNDLADEDTDKISNTGRPFVAKSMDEGEMKQMAVIFLLISLVSGFLAGYISFFMVLAFTSLYYIYSMPPTRFKLIPLFSSFLISLCMLSAIIAGFFLIAPIKQVSVFPDKLIFGIVTVFFLLANVRDMKDVAGDQSAGIMTVPVLFGNLWGPRIVGAFAVLAFILIPLLSKIYTLFIPAIPTAILSWYFINKKPYSEKPIDTTYFIFMAVSFLLVFIA